MSDHIVDANKMATPRTIPRCDHCGSSSMTLTGCPVCGAPTCCQQCCRIDSLERELAAANAEVARLKETLSEILPALEQASGCSAKDLAMPGNALTADEVAALWMARAIMEGLDTRQVRHAELELANERIACLEQWIRALEPLDNSEVGWIEPDKRVFVGADKPEGLR